MAVFVVGIIADHFAKPSGSAITPSASVPVNSAMTLSIDPCEMWEQLSPIVRAATLVGFLSWIALSVKDYLIGPGSGGWRFYA